MTPNEKLRDIIVKAENFLAKDQSDGMMMSTYAIYMRSIDPESIKSICELVLRECGE